MRTIWKYRIEERTETVHEIPRGARFLWFTRDPVHGYYNAYYEVDTEAELAEVTHHLVGTGKEVPEDATYRGSERNGFFVWHLHTSGAYLQE